MGQVHTDAAVRGAAASSMLHRAFRRVAPVALALAAFAAFAAPPAHSDSTDGGLKTSTIEELKSAYQSCNRAALGGELSSAAIMHCSIIYEELKERAFGGDFAKLLAWSRQNPAIRKTAR